MQSIPRLFDDGALSPSYRVYRHPGVARPVAPCCDPWLQISMYNPERLIDNGLIPDPEPERTVPAPPPVELYNIADDPLERRNLAEQHPDRVRNLLCELET